MEQLKEIAEKLGLTFQAAWPHYVSYLQIRAVWPALCCILVCLVLAWFLYIPKATRQGWQDLIENETDAKEKETLSDDDRTLLFLKEKWDRNTFAQLEAFARDLVEVYKRPPMTAPSAPGIAPEEIRYTNRLANFFSQVADEIEWRWPKLV